MSVRKLTARMIAVVTLMAAMQTTSAQDHSVPPVDPFAFDPDYRWFEPIYEADLIDVKPKKRANTGWFGTWDRLNLYGSRPETALSNGGEYKLDHGDGVRYELGYMLPKKDTGYLFTWTNNDVYDGQITRQERLNRYSLDDLNGTADDSPAGPPFGFIEPAADRNNLGFNTRFYDVTISNNIVNFDSYEFNKTWRLEPYHYGGILEPMVGIRWSRIQDVNLQQTYSTTQDNLTPSLQPNPDPLVNPLPFSIAEQLDSDWMITDNEVVTGQLGFRYFKYKGRFLYSTDFRVFAGGNWQCLEQYSEQDLTIYAYADGNAEGEIGTPPVYIEENRTTSQFIENDEFVVGFDVRGELGYQLTKAISIRGGFQLIDFGRGVWRGGVTGSSDQDLLMLGGTFGITLNR